METQHKDLRAVVDTKADRKEVVFRHEVDELVTKICTTIIDRRMKKLEDEYAEFKSVTVRRLNKAESEIPILRNKLAQAADQITKQGTKIGNLQTCSSKTTAGLQAENRCRCHELPLHYKHHTAAIS